MDINRNKKKTTYGLPNWDSKEDIIFHLQGLFEKAKENGRPRLFDGNVLVFNPLVAQALGLNEAIILEQIQYWIRKVKEQKEIDNQVWTYNSYPKWRKENFPFISESEIRRSIKKLEVWGILISNEYNKMKGDRTKWYAINVPKLYEVVAEKLIEWHENEEKRVAKENEAKQRKWAKRREEKAQARLHPSVQIDQVDLSKRSDDLIQQSGVVPEISSEISSRNSLILKGTPASLGIPYADESINSKEKKQQVKTEEQQDARYEPYGLDRRKDEPITSLLNLSEAVVKISLVGIPPLNESEELTPDENGRFPAEAYKKIFEYADQLENYLGRDTQEWENVEKGAIKKMLNYGYSLKEINDLACEWNKKVGVFSLVEIANQEERNL